MTPPGGRPKAAEPRTNVTSVRMSDAEHAAAVEGAQLDGQDLGPWMREAVLEAAKRARRRASRAQS